MGCLLEMKAGIKEWMGKEDWWIRSVCYARDGAERETL